MKVLIIGPFPNPINGCSFANQILIKNLEKRNVKTGFVNTNTNVISTYQGDKFSIKKTITFLHIYLKVLKILGNDIVYITPGQTFYGVIKYSPFIIFCILSRVPYIIHIHGNYLGKQYKLLKGFKKKLFNYLISKASAGIVLSESLVCNFDGLLSSNKIFVVKNFVERSLFLNISNKNIDKLRILYLSNLMREKGILELLESLIELKRDGIDFKAIIAGSLEYDIESDIKQKFQILGDSVEYLGSISGDLKQKQLESANVFVLPTYYQMEGQPISLLEGLSTGNIIVTTNHAGIPDVITPENGFIISKQSSKDISEILKLIDRDLKNMVNKFSNYNRKYSQSCFTEEIFTTNLLNIFYATAKSANV